MKKSLFLLLMAAGCGGTDSKSDLAVETDAQRLEKSRQSWLASAPETYSYEVVRSYGNSWNGPVNPGYWHTVVTVTQGKVTCRKTMQENPDRVYVERGDEAGSHPWGFPALTMDDFYSRCSQIVGNNSVFFSLDEGILRSCFLPLPDEVAEQRVSQGIDDRIDIDKFHPDKILCP